MRGAVGGDILGSVAGDQIDLTEFEDVLDRLEVWHRGTSQGDGAAEDDRSEVPARR